MQANNPLQADGSDNPGWRFQIEIPLWPTNDWPRPTTPSAVSRLKGTSINCWWRSFEMFQSVMFPGYLPALSSAC